MRAISFRSQTVLPNGTHMCTTACLHMAVAILSKMLDLDEEQEEGSLQEKLNRVMQIASVSQGHMESGSQFPRMLSVHEIIHECGVSLPKLGLGAEEVFVSEGGGVEEGSCIVRASQLPERMRHPSVGLATGSGHTVCAICYGQRSRRYAFLDTLPGTLSMDLDGEQLVHKICQALRILPRKAAVVEGEERSRKRGRAVAAAAEHPCDVTIFFLEK